MGKLPIYYRHNDVVQKITLDILKNAKHGTNKTLNGGDLMNDET